ncbi:SRPBCC domain-containing protein, partial [Streptomyces sp. ISL-11]|uniref:SRPBCC domain-containing protein n=1 Tax=Streptomyces sp. ISL-11 TaxID=2819174 RepID=UPI0027E5AEB1
MFVPFPVESVRRVLADPARVVRCVPGLQQDAADASGALVAGRLRLRIGGSTITYRGSLHLTERDGAYELSGEGTEVRGSGTVTLSLRGLLETTHGGTRLFCTGTVGSGGRLAEFDEKTAESTARRLLDRFAAALAEELREDAEEEAGGGSRLEGGSVFDTEVPPPSLDAATEDDLDAEDLDEDDLDDEPPAEAAHARRTMIGRSAEEVDHAPPRGRYAPVPAPEAASAAAAALRWAA